MVGASIGGTGMIYPHNLPAFRNQNMWCFRSKNKELISQLLVKFFVDEGLKKLKYTASGSARDFFRKEEFLNMQLSLPDYKIMKDYSSYSNNILKIMSQNTEETQKIIEIKKLLLKKLTSGELFINERYES